MSEREIDAIVIGAGIGGLSAALSLAKAGRNVIVLEASGRVGGRIVRMERNGDAIEAGAQGIHNNYAEMLKLVAEFGLSGDLVHGVHGARFLDYHGEPRAVMHNADMMKIVGPRGALDLIRYRTLYHTLRKRMPQFEIVRDAPDYDNVTAAEALSWASMEFFDFVLRPQTHAQCATSPEHVNLYHLVNMLRIQLKTYPMVLKGGIVSLCQAMAQKLDVRLNMPAAKLLMSGDRVEGVEIVSGERLKARHVIVATTIGAAAALVPDELAHAKSYLSGFTNSPLPLVMFFLDRPINDDAYASFAHAFQPDAVYNMTLNHARMTPATTPSGKAIISAWPAYPGGAWMAAKSDSEIIAQALRDLAPMHPGIAAMVEEARVQRHDWGIARYEPGAHRRLLAFKRYAQGLRGVSFAGNDYDGVHMEAAVRGGLRAALRALQA